MMQMGSQIEGTLVGEANRQIQQRQAYNQNYANWWRQVEAQQVAQQRQAQSFIRPPTAIAAAPAGGAAAAAGPVISARASTELIRWPTVLLDPRFDEARAKIEAPYRRVEAESKPMTADDYVQMVATANGMKATLKQMAYEISAAEYMATEQFLDQLIKEAEARAEAKEKASAQPAPATEEAKPEPQDKA
jgi:hypothetical protein